MRRLARWWERLGQAMGAAAMTAGLAFPIFYDVLARKARAPTTWVFELSQYALITGSFLANAFALKQGNHFHLQRAPLSPPQAPAGRSGPRLRPADPGRGALLSGAVVEAAPAHDQAPRL